jgi:hypothetical protein
MATPTATKTATGAATKTVATSAVKEKTAARATAKTAAKTAIKTLPVPQKWAGNVPELKPGNYADGIPFHELQYFACKLILKPNHFTSRKSLFDFADVMSGPAAEHGVTFSTKPYANAPVQVREVLFLDTPDFRLYKNAFILRRRIRYHDGFPVGEPEVVFKFRHQDLQTTAETDVRPQIQGDYRVKFKIQALPLKDRLGGIRMLYSHNVQFPRSHLRSGAADVLSMATILEVFPVLKTLGFRPEERVELVGETMVEEVLQDIGVLDFGEGISAKVNVSLWRTRGEHRPLIGEFAYQLKFQDRKEVRLRAAQRMEEFFLSLQFAAKDWITLNATKTGVVYRLKGNAPNAHE